MCVYSEITERIFYAPARACSFVWRACCCLITLSLLLFLFRLDRICLLVADGMRCGATFHLHFVLQQPQQLHNFWTVVKCRGGR